MARRYDSESSDDDEPRHRIRDRRDILANNGGDVGKVRDGGDSGSSDSDVDRRNHRRGGVRKERVRVLERRGDGRNGGGRDSDSSDLDVGRTNRRGGGDGEEREKEMGLERRRGSEDGREEINRELEGRRGSERREQGEGRDRHRSRGRDEREMTRLGSERREREERERNRRREEIGRRYGRKRSDSESDSKKERRRRERRESDREETRKRYHKEEDGEVRVSDGRVNRSDSDSDGEEKGRMRGARLESERPGWRCEEEAGVGRVLVTDELSTKKGGGKEKDVNGESDSEGSGERYKSRIERRERERASKRMQVVEEDKKGLIVDRKVRNKRDDEPRRSERGRDSDSESSGRERRRRHKRDRERRRHREDEGTSSDSDGRRKRYRRGERKDMSRKDRRRDLEDGETRSGRGRTEKGSREYKQDGKDSMAAEEGVKPRIQPTTENENPGGALGTLGRTGGVYIPPFKLARMMKEVEDKSSVEYQRLSWDALRKSINGLVNKVNATNIKNIIPELFSENLVRGRGLFCRSCMKSQMASPGFTDVFAALVAVVNTRFPEVGHLLLRRIVLQLKRAYKRNDKPQLIAAVKFIAHLVNQQVAHELVALELLTILLEDPTDDSVEVAVDFVKECGSILQDLCPKGLHGIFERFRGILHEGEIDKRVQFLIEGLFAIRKSKFQGHPAVRPELDLVEPEDQLTHEISLDEHIDPEISLDIFRQDPNFVENERKYEDVKKSLLGDESEDEEGSDAGSDEDDDEDDEDEDEDDDEEQMQIKDETETNLINLRRTIYLTIMSSVDFEEAGHKLLKIKLEPGQEMELCIMLLECCSQERTYLRYYGLLGQRFCMINKVHQENFEKCFVQQYSMIHRLETNKLRNVAKFFAHLLGTDALPWNVLAYIRLTEEDTTSSSRIFIKILFQELSEHLGIRLLNERLNDPAMVDMFESIFPKDNPRNTRFSINFFTSIGLGGLTENLREYLKNMPRMIMQQQKPDSDSGSGSSSSGSESSSSESDSGSSSSDESDSDHDKRRKRRKRK